MWYIVSWISSNWIILFLKYCERLQHFYKDILYLSNEAEIFKHTYWESFWHE